MALLTRKLALTLCLATPFLAAPAFAQNQAKVRTYHGTLADGAAWVASVPTEWNRIVLLWSHGYAMEQGQPEDAPSHVREALLAHGYALAGSNYAKAGWAIEEAIPDQIDTLDALRKQLGASAQVIAWGMSMGGLVTTALAEQHPDKIDGALSMCSSMGGAVGMMNMALDGAFAFKTLVAPDTDIAIVNTGDDRANVAKVAAAVADARKTPAGRARVALSAVLAGLPGWTDPKVPRPAPSDFAAQENEMAKAFAIGVFLPRGDQEKRAGGVFSWNTGIDYRKQLQLSGRLDLVQALYKSAGISLDKDLQALAQARRISADPSAVEYMKRFYTPNMTPGVPVLAVQAIGDGMTSPSLQYGYAQVAAGKVPQQRISSRWLSQAGHCNFSEADVLASVEQVRSRIETGSWPAYAPPFVPFIPSPMLRSCVVGGECH
jgi:pimeloyl-ACP methyl ester carboxylesterase